MSFFGHFENPTISSRCEKADVQKNHEMRHDCDLILARCNHGDSALQMSPIDGDPIVPTDSEFVHPALGRM
jgi:hypothetical protein